MKAHTRMKAIPGRVLRLGQGFDFIVAVSHPLVACQIESMKLLIAEEVAASRTLAKIAFGKEKVSVIRRRMDAGRTELDL